jgi:hypothetical protein
MDQSGLSHETVEAVRKFSKEEFDYVSDGFQALQYNLPVLRTMFEANWHVAQGTEESWKAEIRGRKEYATAIDDIIDMFKKEKAA